MLMGPTLMSLQTFHTARIRGPGYIDIDADGRRITLDHARDEALFRNQDLWDRVEPQVRYVRAAAARGADDRSRDKP